MARASDGAPGSALGKPVRASPAGASATGGVSAKSPDRTKPMDRVSRPGRLQVRRLSRLWGVTAQFLTDVRAEMNRVAWPDRQTVTASTIVVVFVLIVTSAYLAGWDFLFAQLFNHLFRR